MSGMRRVWHVTLHDIARQGDFSSEHRIIAKDAAGAEAYAIQRCGPVNDGKGYVYRLQATLIKFLMVID